MSNLASFNLVGIRPGEKIHEDMISSSEGRNTIEFPKYYIISHENFFKKKKIISTDFSYNSKNNKRFLSIEDLKLILKKFKNNN
jgi:FlaA1/EpsC-like NDP-sugar epimerase